MNLVCTQGDKDSHKGTVLEGDSKVIIGGKPATYVGAKVSSDSSGHKDKKIVSTSGSGRTYVLGGAAKLAASGSKVSCNAKVIGTTAKSTYLC